MESFLVVERVKNSFLKAIPLHLFSNFENLHYYLLFHRELLLSTSSWIMIFLEGCNHGIPMAVMSMWCQGNLVILKASQQTQAEVTPLFQITQNAGKARNKILQAKYPLVLLTKSLLVFVFGVLFRDPMESKQHWNWSTQMKRLAIYLSEASRNPSFSFFLVFFFFLSLFQICSIVAFTQYMWG